VGRDVVDYVRWILGVARRLIVIFQLGALYDLTAAIDEFIIPDCRSEGQLYQIACLKELLKALFGRDRGGSIFVVPKAVNKSLVTDQRLASVVRSSSTNHIAASIAESSYPGTSHIGLGGIDAQRCSMPLEKKWVKAEYLPRSPRGTVWSEMEKSRICNSHNAMSVNLGPSYYLK